ncbi:MAG: branched-chain amino acid transport system II carrier protein [Deltaproteobacteria bacterium]|nr:branched-chain amino acid transport system II carrier protein [Deltaproteobacteria bacterium]
MVKNSLPISKLTSIGLAIFSMFFGAGNLIFALRVGTQFKDELGIALSGFLITAVLLPIIGVLAVLPKQGNLHRFFEAAGNHIGTKILCYVLFAVIGPCVAMPRIVTLSHTIISPFVPWFSLFGFTLLFLAIVFLLAWSESKIIEILGNFISPLLLISLATFVLFAFVRSPLPTSTTPFSLQTFFTNLKYGYNTLDFLTAPFFASVILSILSKQKTQQDEATLFKSGLIGSIIGVSLLGLVYLGLSLASARVPIDLAGHNEAEVLSLLSIEVLGPSGAILQAIIIVLACISTIIALAAVSAEFFQKELFPHSKQHYWFFLLVSLSITGVISNFGLSRILSLSKPIIEAISPAILMLCVGNILDWKFAFKHTKLLVWLTLGATLAAFWLS